MDSVLVAATSRTHPISDRAVCDRECCIVGNVGVFLVNKENCVELSLTVLPLFLHYSPPFALLYPLLLFWSHTDGPALLSALLFCNWRGTMSVKCIWTGFVIQILIWFSLGTGCTSRSRNQSRPLLFFSGRWKRARGREPKLLLWAKVHQGNTLYTIQSYLLFVCAQVGYPCITIAGNIYFLCNPAFHLKFMWSCLGGECFT